MLGWAHSPQKAARVGHICFKSAVLLVFIYLSVWLWVCICVHICKWINTLTTHCVFSLENHMWFLDGYQLWSFAMQSRDGCLQAKMSRGLSPSAWQEVKPYCSTNWPLQWVRRGTIYLPFCQSHPSCGVCVCPSGPECILHAKDLQNLSWDRTKDPGIRCHERLSP